MKKHCWVPGSFGVAAKVYLGLVLWLGGSVAAMAAFHPVRTPQPRAVNARHSRHTPAPVSESRRDRKPARRDKASSSRRKPAAESERSAGSRTKSRRHQQRREAAEESDPVPLSRVRSHRRGDRAKSPAPRRIARQAPSLRSKPEVFAANSAVNNSRPATPQDFARAAGDVAAAQPAAEIPATEIFDRGESHPDDDERMPNKHTPASAQIVATVTAAPEPITPAGKPNLQDKLHTVAVKAESAVKADASTARQVLTGQRRNKPSILPEDHAGKVDVINDAMTPMVLPTLYTRRGRLVMPPPMKGSWDILVHQNTMANNEGLARIQDDDDLDRLRANHSLVPLVSNRSLEVNGELPLNRRFARPWAARFAADTARGFYARFHTPLRLNSAVRTVQYQIRLQRVNGNAAAVDGDGASPHLTGQALDFGKRGMSATQIAWMRAYLAPLMQAGKIDVEEEFQQACFHISVYRSYMPTPKTKPTARVEVAQDRGVSPASALPATAITRAEPTLR